MARPTLTSAEGCPVAENQNSPTAGKGVADKLGVDIRELMAAAGGSESRG